MTRPFTGEVVPLLATSFSSCEPSEFAYSFCWVLIGAGVEVLLDGSVPLVTEASVNCFFPSTSSVGTGMIATGSGARWELSID